MPDWYTAAFAAPIDELLRDQLVAQIPGIRVANPWRITVPGNALGLAETFFAKYDLETQWSDVAGKPVAALHATELREWVPAFLTKYQREGVAWANARRGAAFIWPTGGGKTLGAIAWGLSAPGTLIFVTRAGARRTIRDEFLKYSTVEPEIVTGEALEEAQWENPRVVIIGWENLPAWIGVLKGLRPTSVVFDEAHKSKSHKRWDARIKDDGGVSFAKKENIAAAAMDLSRCCKRRLATTATPIRDRLRDLWAQLDLIEPQAWGSYWQWAARYCGATPGKFGGMDDSGRAEESVLAELRKRTRTCWHVVSHSETHGALPPKRRIVTYLSGAEQSRPGPYSKEMKRAAKVGGEALLEVQLAEAASRKRARVVELVTGQLESGGKVVVFTGRKADAAVLEDAIRSKAPVDAQIWQATGSDTPAVRDDIREKYMAALGKACLIGTGDAFGESVNLQDTDLLLISMLPCTPGALRQWEGRVARLGQKRPVLIQYLIAEGTVDERVASLILEKLPSVEQIVGDEELRNVGNDMLGDPEELKASLISKLTGVAP